MSYLIVLMSCCATASAGGGSVKRVKPAPEQEQLRFFTGDWKCEVKVAAGPQGPERTARARYASHFQADKFWYSVRYVIDKVDHGAMLRETVGHCGYDSQARQFVCALFGNQGEWELITSQGWKGEEWVWSGELNNFDGHKLPLRQIITSRGPWEFSDRTEVNVDGEWRAFAADTSCKKSAN